MPTPLNVLSVTADPSRENHLGLTAHQCALNGARGERCDYVHFTAMPPLFSRLARDPGEFEGRVEDPAYRPQVLAYAQRRLSWRMNHGDRAPTQNALAAAGPVSRPSPRC